MAVKNALFSSTITTTTIVATLLLLLTLSNTRANPDHPHEHSTTKTHQLDDSKLQKLVASDAITMSIHEGYDVGRFIASIPLLRSLRLTFGQDEDASKALLYDCQEHLNVHLNEVSNTLHRLLHESYHKTPHLILADTLSMKDIMDHAVGLACSEACHMDHKFLVSLLKRRLQSFSQTIDDVVDLVSPHASHKATPTESGHHQAKTHP